MAQRIHTFQMRRAYYFLFYSWVLYSEAVSVTFTSRIPDLGARKSNFTASDYHEVSRNEDADTDDSFRHGSFVEIHPHLPVYERYKAQILQAKRALAQRTPLQVARPRRLPIYERGAYDSPPTRPKVISPYEELLQPSGRPTTSAASTTSTTKPPPAKSPFESTLSRMQADLRGALSTSSLKHITYSEEERSDFQRIEKEVAEVCRFNQASKRSRPSDKSPERLASEEIAKHAMSILSDSPLGSVITIKNVKDTSTGKIVLEKGYLTVRNILGVGGTGTVFLASIDPRSQPHLGFKEMALKLLNLSLPPDVLDPHGSIVNQRVANEIYEEVMRFLDDETQPVKSMTRLTKANSAVEVAERLQWAIPLFTAEIVGYPDDLLIVNGVVHVRNVLLSEVMIGDATNLMGTGTGKAPARSLSMEARQYVCSKLIDEVAAMHMGSMYHYDIKPENIFISTEGKPMLGDFGMTARVGETRICANKITMNFMEPRHAGCFLRGGTVRVNASYDAWSVGLTCFMLMVEGRMPFGLKMDDPIEDTIKKIAKLEAPCYLPRGPCPPSPGEELLKSGVSNFWAALIHLLLLPRYFERPTLIQIANTYSKRPVSSTADLQ